MRYALMMATAALSASMFPAIATAQDGVEGRTGLPVVRTGQQKVWMPGSRVVLKVSKGDLVVSQFHRLRFPGSPIEKNPVRILVAVREDYYRAGRKVTEREAVGFRAFAATIDGKPAEVSIDPWTVNAKGDTATRWRTFFVSFEPGAEHKVNITSRAPLGRKGGRRTVGFISKDVGHWRQAPDFLEIRMEAPGDIETRVAGVTPKPNDTTAKAMRWMYHKASPNRDIYVLLPATYRTK